MKQTLTDRVLCQRRRVSQLLSKKSHVDTTVEESLIQMDKVLAEQDLLERTTVAVQQAKPLLSASSIKQCENLANSAIQSVFELPYTVEYNPESCRFLLNKGDYYTDLAEAEGGGIVTAISFVFDIYLLVKLGKRRFMTFDEHFTQISSKYFSNFIEFVKQLCNDLGVDILLISHDARIQSDMCDRVYVIENGISKRLK